MNPHHGECRTTNYECRSTRKVIQYQTAEKALEDALKGLLRTWNERKKDET